MKDKEEKLRSIWRRDRQTKSPSNL